MLKLSVARCFDIPEVQLSAIGYLIFVEAITQVLDGAPIPDMRLGEQDQILTFDLQPNQILIVDCKLLKVLYMLGPMNTWHPWIGSKWYSIVVPCCHFSLCVSLVACRVGSTWEVDLGTESKAR